MSAEPAPPRVALALLAAVGAVLVLVTTRHGVGKGTDALAYIGAARNIVHGHGVTTPFTIFTSRYRPRTAAGFVGAVPLTHFPPLFPVVLATGASLGIAVTTVVRVLNAALLGLNLYLTGLVAWQVERSRVFAVAVVVFLLTGSTLGDAFGGHDTWLRLHSFAQSEPLFITCVLIALLALPRYLRDGRTVDLAIVTAAASLAFLTRYAGAALIAAAFVLVVSRRTDRATRVRHGTIFLAGTLAPTAMWSAYNSLVRHASSPRSLGLHYLAIRGMLDVIGSWFVPTDWPSWVRTVAFVVAVALAATTLRAASPRGRNREEELRAYTSWALAAYGVAYIGVVFATRTFLDASTPIDDRLFAPLEPVVVILAFAGVVQLLRTRLRSSVAGAVGVALMVVVSIPGWSVVRKTVADGIAPPPVTSPIVRDLAPLRFDTLVVTDVPHQVYDETGRSTIIVPTRINPLTGKRDPTFESRMTEMVGVVRAKHGVVVLLGGSAASIRALTGLAGPDDFVRHGLIVERRTPDGGVLLGA
ncbi:MAG: hypothetical protein JWL83_4848 [Actinomycetia bacterium]|nr:hypothetical protein [Actinomycetes bacterium]